jgi:hypothetical protein
LTDVWFYGVLPSILYALLAVVSWAFWIEARWAVNAISAIITGLLLVSIRNEWDLVTWLAPRPDSRDEH